METYNNFSVVKYSPKGLLYGVLDFVGEISTISGTEKLIYTFLTKYSFGQYFTFISQERLARLCSYSIRTVQRGLKRLERINLIEVVKQGKFTQYHFTIPKEFQALAIRFRLIGDNLSPAPQENADSGSFFSETDDNLAKEHDNLSYISKSLGLNTNTPPISPTDSSKDTQGTNNEAVVSGSSPSSQDSSLLEQFTRLFAAYPPRGNREKAFKVFCRLHSVLPEINKLIQCVEYEKVHNKKWQRGYAFFLEKWLNQGLYKETMPFIKRTAKQQAHGIEAQSIVAQALSSDLLQKEKAQNVPSQQQKVEIIQPFNEQEFTKCAELWHCANPIHNSLNKIKWNTLLANGIAPLFAEAQRVKNKFSSFFEWLQSFKNEQLVGA